ncbi:MAG: hypothetical protein ABI345_02200 [Jatrophihabitans sp.]
MPAPLSGTDLVGDAVEERVDDGVVVLVPLDVLPLEEGLETVVPDGPDPDDGTADGPVDAAPLEVALELEPDAGAEPLGARVSVLETGGRGGVFLCGTVATVTLAAVAAAAAVTPMAILVVRVVARVRRHRTLERRSRCGGSLRRKAARAVSNPV